jgi:hypothetical protein
MNANNLVGSQYYLSRAFMEAEMFYLTTNFMVDSSLCPSIGADVILCLI